MNDNIRHWIESSLSRYLVFGAGVERKVGFPLGRHGDRNASASVNTETGAWYCHSYKEGGGLKQLARDLGVALRPDRTRQEKKSLGEIVDTYSYQAAADRDMKGFAVFL